MAEIRTVAQVMVEHLAAAGIDTIFGYPGDPNIELIEAARRRGIRLVLGAREGTVGFMAEATGMLTGRPGVCLSTLGPGSTALTNAVANAYLDRVPMIAVSGQISTAMEPYFTHQVVNHDQLYAGISKWAVRMVPASAAAIMRKALRVAVAERPGPVHLTTAADVIGAPSPDADVRLPPLAPVAGAPQLFATDPGMADMAVRLAEAQRPVILTGISALRAGATPALVRLAERMGAPVVVSPMSKGVFPEDHPLYASTVDMACNAVVWEFLGDSDLLLIAGFDAVELIKPWKLSVPAIHVDSVPNTDQIYAAGVELVGDIPFILEALADGVRGEARDGEARVASHRARLRETFYAGRKAGRLNPTDVIDAMNASLPADTIVSTDVGSHKLLVGQGWRARTPRSFLMTNGLSSMGFALPAAIAAKLARPDCPVVCTTGDGGFAMVQSELRTAASLGLGIMVVVFCDNSLNRIELKQMRRQYPSELTRIDPSDLVRIAEAMDCDGIRVESPDALADIVSRAPWLERPLLVQAVIDPAQYDAQF
jgi:acetolactate synthase I/II/III large subunit